MKRYFSIALAVLVLALSGLYLFSGCSAPGATSGARAAIVDQLSVLWPNQAFIDEVTAQLEACGFKVDVYRGEEVSVEFYRELPKYSYKLIIFRAHSGLMGQIQGSQVEELKAIYLFTGETYKTTKYVREQLTDQMVEAEMTADYPSVFAISHKFLLNSMKGEFDNTAIIMMGCSGTYRGDMAAAFIQKGAATYLGWNGSIGLDYVDEAATILITNLCGKGMTIDKAVRETMAEVGPYPEYNARLQYYPAESGNYTVHTIKELISRVD